MLMIPLTKNGNWKLFWGAMPLPVGADAIGTIKRGTLGLGDSGWGWNNAENFYDALGVEVIE